MTATDPTYAGGYRLVNGQWILTAPPAGDNGPSPDPEVSSAIGVALVLGGI